MSNIQSGVREHAGSVSPLRSSVQAKQKVHVITGIRYVLFRPSLLIVMESMQTLLHLNSRDQVQRCK
jgi:hypothetical protein